MSGICVVLSTVPTREEGLGIGRRLVEERLAAAVNVVPGVRSVYAWQGAVHEGDEALLLIKTRRDCYPAVARRIQELHSYTVPGILALPVEAGAGAYVDWVNESVAPGGGEGTL